MKNRVISLLLAVVLLLGMIPAVSAAPAEEPTAQDITVDFRATVKEMAEQPWWDALPTLKTASGFDVRRIGDTYTKYMSQTESAAYDEMLAAGEGKKKKKKAQPKPKVEEPMIDEYDDEYEDDEKLSKAPIIILGIAILVVAAVIVYMLLK